MKKPPTNPPSGITGAPNPHSGWGLAARVTATKNRPIPPLLLALNLAAVPAAFAQAPTPAQMMRQSAAATYQQQQQQQQALMGHLHSNTARRAYGGNAYGEGAYYHTDPEEWSTAETMVEAPIADALDRCRSDPAVNPRTCAAPPVTGYKGQKYHCALPKKTGRHH